MISEQGAASETAQLATANLIAARNQLQQRIFRGAIAFFAIAGLSLLNSILYLFNVFIASGFGLGMTQVIDGTTSKFAAEFGEGGIIFRVVGMGLGLFVSGMFVFFGYFASKRHGWAFVLGGLIYAGDALLFLVVRHFGGLSLHILFLFWILRGYMAVRTLNQAEAGNYQLLIAESSAVPARKYWFGLGLVPTMVLACAAGVLLLLLIVSLQ